MNVAPLTYCGVGSRITPPEVLHVMRRAANRLSADGWTLRTGGASGADKAFIGGHRSLERVQVFLPWAGYNGWGEWSPVVRSQRPTSVAVEIAEATAGHWFRMQSAARRFYARNVHVALGADCRQPAAMMITWTPDGSLDGRGEKSGGAGQCLRVLLAHNPRAIVWNLARDIDLSIVRAYADGRNVDLGAGKQQDQQEGVQGS